jgi:hypothetical protein
MGFYSAPTARKPSRLTRVVWAILKSDVVVPSAVIAGLASTVTSIWTAMLVGFAMAMILSEIANLKDEIRKK